MKTRLLIILTVILSFSVNLNAQKDSNGGQVFSKNNFIVNAGIGFGWYTYDYGLTTLPSQSSLPVITIGVEKGVYEIPKIGIISAGGIFGWKHSSYSESSYDFFGVLYSYKGTINDIVIAPRAAFHQTMLKIDKLDLYAGLALGLRFETAKVTDSQLLTTNSATTTSFLASEYVGARYYLTKNFAAYSELGYGLGYFTMGLSYKF